MSVPERIEDLPRYDVLGEVFCPVCVAPTASHAHADGVVRHEPSGSGEAGPVADATFHLRANADAVPFVVVVFGYILVPQEELVFAFGAFLSGEPYLVAPCVVDGVVQLEVWLDPRVGARPYHPRELPQRDPSADVPGPPPFGTFTRVDDLRPTLFNRMVEVLGSVSFIFLFVEERA